MKSRKEKLQMIVELQMTLSKLLSASETLKNQIQVFCDHKDRDNESLIGKYGDCKLCHKKVK